MSAREDTRAWKLRPMRLAEAANHKFVQLGRLIARLLDGRGSGRRSTPRGRSDNGRFERTASAVAANEQRTDELDWIAKRKLRELFHKDAAQRLAAARWFRRHRRREVVPALGGMLSIEENQDVRREIVRALREFGPATHQRGGERCSRSSAV